MVHLEMSYLTHSKFFIMMIPDILPLFRARFRIFLWTCNSNSLPPEIRNNLRTLMFFSSSAWGLEWFRSSSSSASILLRSRFEADLDLLILLSSSARGSKLIWIYWYFYPPPLEIRSWSWFTDTPILLRPRFEADLDLLILLSSLARGSKLILILLILLSSSARGSKLIANGDLFTLLDLHLEASQTWFCFGLTLESQSNLVMFRSYTWKPVKLVVQILPYVYLPRLTLHYQSSCAFDFATLVYLIGLTPPMPMRKRLQI